MSADNSVTGLTDNLTQIADNLTPLTFRASMAKAAQIARRLDRDAATDIWYAATSWDETPAMVAVAKGMIEGVAEASIIDGVSSTGVSAANVINMTNVASAEAVALTVSHSLDALLVRSDLPDEVRPEVVALKDAIESGEDKPGLLARAAKIGVALKTFPDLAQSVYDIVRNVL